MKIKDNVTSTEVLECVKIYEKNYKFEYNENSSIKIKDTYLFSGPRNKEKIIIISLSKFPLITLRNCIKDISNAFDKNNQLSDIVDFFSLENIDTEERKNLEGLFTEEAYANLNIIDLYMILEDPAFSEIVQMEDESETNSSTVTILYDYLSNGVSASKIKTGILNSMILFEIYDHDKISPEELSNKISAVLGKKDYDIKTVINTLKRHDKIQSKHLGELSLSNNERNKITTLLKESKSEEKKFMCAFNELCKNYKVTDVSHLLNEIKSLYTGYYSYNLDEDFNKYEQKQKQRSENFKQVLAGIVSKEEIPNITNDIKKLCSDNTFINHISVSTSFLNLYKSDKLENYVNARTNCIYLDTPAFMYYICCLSGYDDYYDQWEDSDYKAIANLIHSKENNNFKINFHVPYEYLNETVGEFKKAKRISWLESFSSLPILPVSDNIFYNYYTFIKKQKEELDKDTSFNFDTFSKNFGITITDEETTYFTEHCIQAFKSFANMMGCIVEPENKEKHASSEDIEQEYILHISENSKKHRKTRTAITNDIKTAFLLTNKSNQNDDIYLVSWDNSLRFLRDKLKQINALYRSYAIYKPNALTNSLSLKNFKINSECISEELFTYADKEYDLTTKMKNLFDDVIVPLMGYAKKRNGNLISMLLDLQREFMENDDKNESSSRDSILPLEKFLLDIMDSINKMNSSKQELTLFLSSPDNNDFIVTIMNRAFQCLKDGKEFDIVGPFYKEMKNFIHQQDKEIDLNESIVEK